MHSLASAHPYSNLIEQQRSVMDTGDTVRNGEQRDGYSYLYLHRPGEAESKATDD